jgi:predicted RNA binding protein YcfA (HicA-like mRNA interferase family)
MPKLPPMKAREVEAILARAGFVLDQQAGHRIWRKGVHTVPVPSHPDDVPQGTLRNIIRLAGMSVDDFLRATGNRPGSGNREYAPTRESRLA